MAETYSVSLEKLIEQMELENVTSDVDVSRIDIVQTDVNRPALQLAGFFDYFDSGRIQIIGHVEHTYMEQKGLDYTLEMMEIIMAGSERHTKPPCIVFCRNLHIDEKLVQLASKYQVPILRTPRGAQNRHLIFAGKLNQLLVNMKITAKHDARRLCVTLAARHDDLHHLQCVIQSLLLHVGMLDMTDDLNPSGVKIIKEAC